MENKKKIFDVYISYSGKDRELAKLVTELFEEQGVSLWIADRELTAAQSFSSVIAEAMSSCRCFMPLITENSVLSSSWLKELNLAVNRQKTLLPLCTSYQLLRKSPELELYLGRTLCYQIRPEEPDSVKMTVEKLCRLILGDHRQSDRFDRLGQYLKSGADAKATAALCEIINEECDKLQEQWSQGGLPPLQQLAQLLKYCEKMLELYDYDYSPEGKELARTKLESLSRLSRLRERKEFLSEDLQLNAIAIRLVYYDRQIRTDCADALTGGDVSDGIVNPCPLERYLELQAPYVERYRRQKRLLQQKDPKGFEALAGPWTQTEKQIFMEKTAPPALRRESKPEEKSNDEDSLLQSVAGFFREGNRVLESIGEKEAAADFLRCLITGYERLRAYCEAVGESKVCAECIDRIFELKKRLENSGQEKGSPKAEKGIKSLLGLTVPTTGKFDVFLSHKKEDYDLAKAMYDFLHRELKEVFLDSESLEKMSESKYRRSIMKALDGSDHFVVVCSDLKYLESDWVSLEMETFQSEIDEGRKKGSNFIMVVTDEVCQQIMESNKKLLPIEYRNSTILKYSEYRGSLLGYLPKIK